MVLNQGRLVATWSTAYKNCRQNAVLSKCDYFIFCLVRYYQVRVMACVGISDELKHETCETLTLTLSRNHSNRFM